MRNILILVSNMQHKYYCIIRYDDTCDVEGLLYDETHSINELQQLITQNPNKYEKLLEPVFSF